MKQILTFIAFFLFIHAFGQLENRCQPDSIYQNRRVKKIYAYLNSSKDLSEVIEFDRNGHRIGSVKFSASYDKKTRKRKKTEQISYFRYDAEWKIIQIIDSVIYSHNASRVNIHYFFYDTTGVLTNVKYYEDPYKIPASETFYYSQPYRSTTVVRKDSSVVYSKTKEYDKDFYVNKFYGYYFQAKLKTGFSVYRGDTSTYQYSDYTDMQRFEDTEVIKNTFNGKGQLTTSNVNSVFLNDRTLTYTLSYTYYANGLLKSIRGYVPEYFRYELYE